MLFRRCLMLCILLFPISAVYSQNAIELETIIIKGNKELPRLLYIVPWKDSPSAKQQEDPLVLHSLFGELFEPVSPVTGYDTVSFGH